MKAPRPRSLKLAAAGLLAAITATIAVAGVAYGQAPPTHTTFFGTVQLGGANISPTGQPVIALVNGQTCGTATTGVAANDPSNPPGDIGKTVYTIDVMTDGTGIFQRPGCAESGDTVRFYFPEASRLAAQSGTTIGAGFSRVDLTLGPAMVNGLTAPMMAKDGSP